MCGCTELNRVSTLEDSGDVGMEPLTDDERLSVLPDFAVRRIAQRQAQEAKNVGGVRGSRTHVGDVLTSVSGPDSSRVNVTGWPVLDGWLSWAGLT